MDLKKLKAEVKHIPLQGDYLLVHKTDLENFLQSETAKAVGHEPLVRQGDFQPVFACGSCAECKFEEFYDKFGSHCNKHNKSLNEMFDNLELTLDEIGCKQFEQK